MKVKKLLAVGMLMAVMLFAFAACGGNEASGEEGAADAAVESTAPAEPETIEQAATQQIAEAADTQTKAEDMVGSWVDVNSPDRFVNITADGTAYQYEDNEGKLPATFEEGVLKITVSDTDKADAYIDATTGHLMVVYQDNISEYSKK